MADEKGRVIAGTSAYSTIHTLEPKGDGTFNVVSSVRPQPVATPFDILPLPSSGEYVILGAGATGVQPIHKLSPSGQNEADFGSIPPQITPHLSLRTALNGTLLWDKSHQSILYLPENPFTLAEFAPDGQMLGQYSREDAGFHPVRLDAGTSLPLPNDRVVRAAMLADGNIVVQIVKHDPAGPMTVNSSTYLEVLDLHLRPVAQILGEAPEHLWGSDAKGNLYFTAISPTDGLNIIQAHLGGPAS